jgi:hypothetical protein
MNIKNDTLISKGLTLEKTDVLKDDNNLLEMDKNGGKNKVLGDDPGKGIRKDGDMLRYGVYRLFEQGKYLGMAEIVPCYKGENCKKRSIDKSITQVNVYNHELTFYQDILDAIQANRKMYGKDTNELKDAAESLKRKEVSKADGMTDPMSPAVSPKQDPPKVHIGRGCASGS